jgi:hypothetical protein
LRRRSFLHPTTYFFYVMKAFHFLTRSALFTTYTFDKIDYDDREESEKANICEGSEVKLSGIEEENSSLDVVNLATLQEERRILSETPWIEEFIFYCYFYTTKKANPTRRCTPDRNFSFVLL